MSDSQKAIVLAVSGSVAAYRSCELVRELVKAGIPVEVVMTENGARFVGAETFRALTGKPVHVGSWDEGMLHIDLKNRAAVFAVIPATANIIGKFAAGIADDVVSTTYLAATCPVLMAPSMNPGMYTHPAVQRNLTRLKNDGVIIIDPDEGEVVCGDTGKGKMASVVSLKETLMDLYKKQAGGV